jgi:hypothetical protein
MASSTSFKLYPVRSYVSDGSGSRVQPAEYTQRYEQVRRACTTVLVAMPNDDAEAFVDTCLVSWVPAPGKSCTTVLKRPAQPRRAVWLDARLPCYPNEVMVGIVAHEFAHAICDHRRETETSESESESEADRRATEWGFGKEIQAMRAFCASANGPCP